MKLLAPSILSADFSNLASQVRAAELGSADIIHCDIMDGQFVPNLTFGPIIVSAVRKITKLPIDVHLMIKNPDNLIQDFANAGADYITVHIEEVVHIDRTINFIKQKGIKAGIAINPGTPIENLIQVLGLCDLVLIMSVNPGFGGQSFIDYSLEKIKKIASLRKKNNYNFKIEVDGGINKQNIRNISKAGCNIFVCGSAIFGNKDITKSTTELKRLILDK